MSTYLDAIVGNTTATELATTGAPVNVSNAAPPAPGDVLTAVDGEHAEWMPPAELGVPLTRTIATASPLTGGGDLSANRTLGVAVGTTAGTVAAGDAVLLRAAGDFGAFPSKTTPDDTDVLLAEDGAAAFAKKKMTVATIRAAGKSGEGNPYLIPPVTPNAVNDEFDTVGADLAARGWVIWDHQTGAALTWAGEIQVWTSISYAAAPSAGTYRASIRGSYLFFQLPVVANKLVTVSRAATLATAGTLFGRTFGLNNQGAGADAAVFGVCLMSGTNALPSIANDVELGMTQTAASAPRRQWVANRASALTVIAGVDGISTQNAMDMHAIRYVTPANYRDVSLTPGGNIYTSGAFTTGLPDVANLTRVGFYVFQGNTNPALRLFAIDFIRLYLGDVWIAGGI
jgi:hypothetical protein